MDRDIGQVPMKPAIRTKLLKLGYGKMNSVVYLTDDEILALSAKLELPSEETKSVIELVKSYCGSALPDYVSILRGMDMLLKHQLNPCISTGSAQLDHLLDGGIQIGQLIEISGAPGIGKTQLCFQLCVNVQVPKALSGLQGEAVFIDTDGSFVEKRVSEIALALIEELNTETNEGSRESVEEFNLERILDNITVFRCRDYGEVIKTANILPEFLKHRQVRLIVMDSIASPFRFAFEDMSERSKVLNALTQKLITIAVKHQLAVVLVNQVTTKFGASGEDGHIVPALGASWGHSCGTRVIFLLKNNIRTALLFKSPTKGGAVATFAVTPSGIKDYIPKNSRAVTSGSKKRPHHDEPMPETGNTVTSLADLSHIAEDDDEIVFEDVDVLDADFDFEEARDEAL